MVLEELLLELRQQDIDAGRHRTAGRVGLEDGQRRRQRDTAIDQLLDEGLERLAVLVERRDGLLSATLPWTDVGLLVGHKVRGRQKAVLQVVDAEVSGFGVGDRTEVAGDLQAALWTSSIAARSSSRLICM